MPLHLVPTINIVGYQVMVGLFQVTSRVWTVTRRLPHDLWHTAVRNPTRAGVAEPIAIRMTGHKTRSLFDRYDIGGERDHYPKRGELRLLGHRLNGSPATFSNWATSGSVRIFFWPGTRSKLRQVVEMP